MTTTIVAIVQLIIFLSYIGFIYNRYGILGSISESTYHVETHEKILFYAFLLSIGLLNLFHPMGVYGMITMIGLAFTGVTVNHQSNKSFTRTIHFMGVIVAIISAFLGFIVLHGLWWTTLVTTLLLPILYYFLDKEKFIWNAEVLVMIAIVISYLQI